MTQSYTPRQIAGGLLEGEFARDSAFVPLAEVERLRAELDRTREQLDAAVALIAEWCRAVDGGASWDYWDDHYKQARWGKGVLRSLIDAEIAKLEPLEGEP